MYFSLANFVAILHGIFVIILILGAALAISNKILKSRFWTWVYLSAAISTALSFIIFGSCFLTDLEKYLRFKFDPKSSYQSGFISHYLSFLGIHLPDIAVFWFLTTILVLGLSSTLWYYWKGRPNP